MPSATRAAMVAASALDARGTSILVSALHVWPVLVKQSSTP